MLNLGAVVIRIFKFQLKSEVYSVQPLNLINITLFANCWKIMCIFLKLCLYHPSTWTRDVSQDVMSDSGSDKFYYK